MDADRLMAVGKAKTYGPYARGLEVSTGGIDPQHACKDSHVNLGDPMICRQDAGSRMRKAAVLDHGKSDDAIVPRKRVMPVEGRA